MQGCREQGTGHAELTVGSNEVLPARPGCSAAWRAARRVARGGVAGGPAAVTDWLVGGVAVLGMRYFREGKYETAAEHAPDYLRPSQAERERAEKEHA